jgi:hypothetical protein
MNLYVEEQEEAVGKDANSISRQIHLRSCLTTGDAKSTCKVYSHYCIAGLPYGQGVAVLLASTGH